jgi:hypothetical protein
MVNRPKGVSMVMNWFVPPPPGPGPGPVEELLHPAQNKPAAMISVATENTNNNFFIVVSPSMVERIVIEVDVTQFSQ